MKLTYNQFSEARKKAYNELMQKGIILDWMKDRNQEVLL